MRMVNELMRWLMMVNEMVNDGDETRIEMVDETR